MRQRTTLSSLLAALTIATHAHAADPAVPALWPVKEAQAYFSTAPQPISPEASRLVKELSSPDFATREEASREIKQKGFGAFPGLSEAAQATKDPEAIARVSVALPATEFIVPDNAPAAVRAALDTYSDRLIKALSTAKEANFRPANFADQLFTQLIDGSALLDLTDEGKALFFRILEEQEKDPRCLLAIRNAKVKIAPTEARLAIVAGQFNLAESLLHSSLNKNPYDSPNYAAFIALRRGPAFDPQREINQLQVENSAYRDRAAVFLFRAKGDFNRAADISKNSPAYTEWRSMVQELIEAGRYGELARFIDADTKREKYFVNEATAYLLAGETEKSENALLGPLRDPSIFGTNNRGNVLQSLVKDDRAESAIKFMSVKPDEVAIAFRLLCRQLRVSEALALIANQKMPSMDCVNQLFNMGLIAAARTVLKRVEPDERASGVNAAEYESDLAAMLERAGDAQGAQKWRTRAFALVDAYQDATRELNRKRMDLLDKEKAVRSIPSPPRARGQPAITAPTLLEIQAQKAANDHSISTLLRQSYSVKYDPITPVILEFELARYWLNDPSVTADKPMTTAQRFLLVRGIFNGDYSGEDLVKHSVPEDRSYLLNLHLQMVTRSLQRIHREDLARPLLEQSSNTTMDPTCLSILGDLALHNNKPEEALIWYKKAAMLNLTDASLMYKMGIAYSRRAETVKGGKELQAFAPWLVLGDFEQAQALCNAMVEFEGEAAAYRWFDDYVDRFTMQRLGSIGAHLARKREAAEARGDTATALRFAEQLLFTPRETLHDYPYYQDFMDGVAAYHRSRALDALTRRDDVTLADALWREMDNGPPDVALLERAVPALKQADAAAAKKVVDRALERLRPVVRDYPEAGTYRSQLERVEGLAN